MTTAAAPKLLSTRDYDKFELHIQNRDVTRVDELRKSMQRYGFLPQYPLHCVPNGTKFKIKAGHHRFSVARELGLPVYYVLAEDGDIGIHELERATSAWNLNDYLTSFVREGRGYYVEVKEFYSRTGIPLSTCLSMLGGHAGGSGNMLPPFKRGTFRVTKEGREHANTVARLVAVTEEAGYDFARHRQFVVALSKILFVEELDCDELARRLVKYRDQLHKQPTVNDYVRGLEHLYNYLAKDRRLPLAFLADSVARSRNPLGHLK